MIEADSDWLIEHVVESAKDNPRMARGLRDLIKKAIAEHPPGSEAHSHMLETLNCLNTYIAAEGEGYAKDKVME